MDNTPLTQSEANYSPGEIMKRLGYRSRAAFWNAMRTQGAPMLVITRQRILFPTRAFDAWLESRMTGGRAA